MRMSVKMVSVKDQVKMRRVIESNSLSVDEITSKLLHMKPCSEIPNYHNKLQFLESATFLWDVRDDSDFTKRCNSIAEHIRAIQMKLGSERPTPRHLKIDNGRKLKRRKK